MRISVIDDNKTDREYLSGLIHNCFSKYGFPVRQVTAFESGEAFLNVFEKGTYDLIFLDIYMSGANGIETARKIRETDREVNLIFVTVSNDFASESYAVQAAYYLRKPFCEKDLMQIFTSLHLHRFKNRRIFTLPNGQSLLLESIAYTSFSGHYVTIYLVSGEKLQIRCTQTEWENLLLPFSGFILCTKGMIVNLEEVAKLGSNLFVMKNNAYIPISRRKYADVKQAYSDFLIKKAREGVK